MSKRSSKPKNDSEVSAALVNQIVGMANPSAQPEKNPAAVTLGRLGGLKGGKARALKLSPKKRREIAKKAAKTRWAKKSS